MGRADGLFGWSGATGPRCGRAPTHVDRPVSHSLPAPVRTYCSYKDQGRRPAAASLRCRSRRAETSPNGARPPEGALMNVLSLNYKRLPLSGQRALHPVDGTAGPRGMGTPW